MLLRPSRDTSPESAASGAAADLLRKRVAQGQHQGRRCPRQKRGSFHLQVTQPQHAQTLSSHVYREHNIAATSSHHAWIQYGQPFCFVHGTPLKRDVIHRGGDTCEVIPTVFPSYNILRRWLQLACLARAVQIEKAELTGLRLPAARAAGVRPRSLQSQRGTCLTIQMGHKCCR